MSCTECTDHGGRWKDPREFRPQLADIVEWDIPNWSAALQYWTAHTAHSPASLRALEIGTRHGGLSLWLALQGARVLCSDIDGPSPEAVEKHKRYRVRDRITYAAIDATDIPYTEEFDVVVLKSVLGAVGGFGRKERQIQAISEIHDSLREGGELWFAENLAGSILHRKLRRRFVRWGAKWSYLTVEEMTDLLEGFTHVRYRTLGFLGAFGRSRFQRNILGILDRAVVTRLVPRAWHYVIVGIAAKPRPGAREMRSRGL